MSRLPPPSPGLTSGLPHAPKGSPYDANTAWKTTLTPGNYDPPQVFAYFSDGKWWANVTLQLSKITVSVTFNPKDSWVVKSDETAALLAHEALHFTIAQYIGQKVQSAINASLPLQGFGTASASTRNAAVKKATKMAEQQVSQKLNALLAQWTTDDNSIESAYDTQTNHGQNAAGQANWQSNYQSLVNSMFTWK